MRMCLEFIQVSNDPYHGCIHVLRETFRQDISRRTRTEDDKSAAWSMTHAELLFGWFHPVFFFDRIVVV